MATYEETMLDLGPINYWRLTEASGTVMSDIGTAPVDGTFFPEAIFGRPSPIESDPSAIAIGQRVGIANAPVPVDSFSFGGWGYYNPDEGVASGILCRNGQIGLPGSNMVTIDQGLGLAGARLNPHANPFEFFDLTYALPAPGWYLVTVTRNDTVMRLMVNDALVGETTSFPSGSFTSTGWINGGGFGWKVGVTGDSGNVWEGVRTAETFVFDYPISLANQTAIFEAAFNALFLNGVSNVVPTAVLRSDFEPDPVSFPFRHNWTEPLIERISFRTAISQSVTGMEEGYAERIAPRRELEITQVLKNQSERRRLRALLWANQHRKWFVPVRMYAEQLLEPLTATTTLTPISTAYKDYEIGGWIGFREVDGNGTITHWEERLITSLNPNSVEHEALVHDYAAYRSMVYPVRRALLPPSVSITGHTDTVEELTLNFRLLAEDEAIIPNRITQFSPSIKYRDVEVFDGQLWQSNDWSENREYEVERAIEDLDFDAGVFSYDSDTPGASEVFSYRMTLSGIDNISAFLGWYYERVGALRSIWVPTMQEDFEVLSAAGVDLTVRDTNYSDSFALAEARRDLAFVYFDGSMEFRRVVGFSGTTNETLELDALVPTLTNLRFVSLLKYCRLDADQIELAWHTDNKVVIAWRFREQLHTPEGTGASSLSPSASMSLSASPSGSASPSSSVSPSLSPSLSPSPSSSQSPSSSVSRSPSPSSSISPSSSASPSA